MSDLVQRLRAAPPRAEEGFSRRTIGQEAADHIEKLEAALREISQMGGSDAMRVARDKAYAALLNANKAATPKDGANSHPPIAKPGRRRLGFAPTKSEGT